MGDVVHRATLEYRRSINTPDFPPATWILNPNLSALAGVPQKYWKVSGDTVIEMSAGEKTTVDSAAATALLTAARGTAASRPNDAGAEGTVLRALVLTLIDELNAIRQTVNLHETELTATRGLVNFIRADVAAQSTYAGVRTAITARVAATDAGAANLPDRTATQARTALINKVNAGQADT